MERNTDESRKAFEQWCKTVMTDDADLFMEWGDYSNLYVRLRWEAWQASRAAIEIKLPPKEESSPYEHYMPHYKMDADSVERAIRAAGIKVKD
ncbi:TPA: hypothetical protein ONC42_000532 [Enterobacter kobei]|nr:hypothetical protein [Enterobacter kobei]